jgi:hypothetical protein
LVVTKRKKIVLIRRYPWGFYNEKELKPLQDSILNNLDKFKINSSSTPSTQIENKKS